MTMPANPAARLRLRLRRWAAPLLGAFALLACAAPAFATPVQFTFVGDNGHTVAFTIEQSNPVTSYVDPGEFNVDLTDSTVDGVAPDGYQRADFFTDGGVNGGFRYEGSFQGNVYVVASAGPIVFSGTTSAPTFTPGVYTFDASNQHNNSDLGVLTIGSPGAAGPEVGLGLIPALAALGGLAMTRMRQRAA